MFAKFAQKTVNANYKKCKFDLNQLHPEIKCIFDKFIIAPQIDTIHEPNTFFQNAIGYYIKHLKKENKFRFMSRKQKNKIEIDFNLVFGNNESTKTAEFADIVVDNRIMKDCEIQTEERIVNNTIDAEVNTDSHIIVSVDAEVNTDSHVIVSVDAEVNTEPHIVASITHVDFVQYDMILPCISSTETTAIDCYKQIKKNSFTTDYTCDQNQYDDIYDDTLLRRDKQSKALKTVTQPEQRTAAWYELRKQRITASDLGMILGLNKYEAQYKFILKKTVGLPFESNEYCYHGKKFEQSATLIYQYRYNCVVNEFGLITHAKYNWLAASPDGICENVKFNKTNKSKMVGRMLEIKCPFRREIKTNGEIYDNICPAYYWAQVQQQLECCDLDECDFLQCKIEEYNDRTEFIEDTDKHVPFYSEETQNEKGAIIQLIPKCKYEESQSKYESVIYDCATFIHPPRIDLNLAELDQWIATTISDLSSTHPDYVFDRVVYWKLEMCHNVTIVRDKEWFSDNFDKITHMWNLVKFYQKSKSDLDLLLKYIDSMPKKYNDKIMQIANVIYSKVTNPTEYLKLVDSLKNK